MPKTSRIVSAPALWKMMAVSILAAMAMAPKSAIAFVPAVTKTRYLAAALTKQGVSGGMSSSRLFASVTGSVYEADNSKVVITLYTKEGCTLCDKVKDVLKQVQQDSESEVQVSHSLRQIDITDEDQQDSFDRYKYDIPVLHIGYTTNEEEDSVYWTKHRLTQDEAKEALAEATSGSFEPRQGRPNASAMER